MSGISYIYIFRYLHYLLIVSLFITEVTDRSNNNSF